MRCNIDKELLDGTNVVAFREFHGERRPVVYLDPQSSPVEIGGLPFNGRNRTLCRLPEAGLREQPINAGVSRCGAHRPAGAVFRFRTNSTLIGLRAILGHNTECAVMPREGRCGFSFWEGTGTAKQHVFTACPADDETDVIDRMEGEVGVGAWREWTVYCPLLAEVPYVRLILTHNADIESPTPYAFPRPVIFYGSSVTNGVGASDAGMDYPSRIGRLWDMATVNLGFNGSCHGETAMARLIAEIPDAAAFVYAYDHNAKEIAELEERHEKFFRIVRAAHPQWPILLCSRPNTPENADGRARAALIRGTWERTVARGDRLSWFVDGIDTFPGNDTPRFTGDGEHPTDEGYGYLVQKLVPPLTTALAAAGIHVGETKETSGNL